MPIPSDGEITPVNNSIDVTDIIGDGRCLFRAVAHGAYNTGKDERAQKILADRLRYLTIRELEARKNMLNSIVWEECGMSFAQYTENMALTTTWGGEAEIHMLTHILRRPIIVYQESTDHSQVVIRTNKFGTEYEEEASDEGPIGIFYNGTTHYDAITIHAAARRHLRFNTANSGTPLQASKTLEKEGQIHAEKWCKALMKTEPIESSHPSDTATRNLTNLELLNEQIEKKLLKYYALKHVSRTHEHFEGGEAPSGSNTLNTIEHKPHGPRINQSVAAQIASPSKIGGGDSTGSSSQSAADNDSPYSPLSHEPPKSQQRGVGRLAAQVASPSKIGGGGGDSTELYSQSAADADYSPDSPLSQESLKPQQRSVGRVADQIASPWIIGGGGGDSTGSSSQSAADTDYSSDSPLSQEPLNPQQRSVAAKRRPGRPAKKGGRKFACSVNRPRKKLRAGGGKYNGVYWRKTNQWEVRIADNKTGKLVNLGLFSSERQEKAAEVRDLGHIMLRHAAGPNPGTTPIQIGGVDLNFPNHPGYAAEVQKMQRMTTKVWQTYLRELATLDRELCKLHPPNT